MKKRIDYLDVLKCVAIFLVYCLHCGDVFGRGYAFAFYSVPTFFFVSGCCESLHRNESILDEIFKKIKTILIPWFFLSVLNCCFVSLEAWNFDTVIDYSMITIKGDIRNTALSPGLWFLTCLFVISIIFIFIKRVRSNIVIFAISYMFYFIAQFCLNKVPTNSPCFIYNIDSAMSYLIYYASGYIMFGLWKRKSENSENKALLVALKYIIGIGAIAYTIFIWFGRDILFRLYNFKYYAYCGEIINNIIVVIGLFTISLFFRSILLFNKIGQETLFLCGTELISKNIFNSIFGMFDLKIDFYRPLTVYIYAMLTLAFSYFIIIPIAKRIYHLVIDRGVYRFCFFKIGN